METLGYLDDLVIARAAREHLPVIERLLADDQTSPRHVATANLLSDDMLGAPCEPSRVETMFAQIDADPNQVLAVVLDDTERVVGTFQLSFVPTLARGGALRTLVTGARIRSGSDAVAIARQVFGWITEHARRRGARVLIVTIDKDHAHMLGFYTTLGFRPSHEGLTLPL